MAYDKNSYTRQYNATTYHTVTAYIPKARKEALKAAAAERGLTVSQLVVRALEDYCKIDLS